MARKRGKSRWLALAAVVLIAFVYSANQPFYAGSSLGPNHKWRMEHGRLTLTRSSVVVQTSFWMDYNSEGMR
jgi:hypothetical protein